MIGSSELGVVGAVLGNMELGFIGATTNIFEIAYTDTLTLSEDISVNATYNLAMTDVLTSHESINLNFSRSLILTDTLEVIDSFSTNKKLNLTYTDTIIIQDPFITVTLDNIVIQYPNIIYTIDNPFVKKKLLVTLEGFNSSIKLPAPLFKDVENSINNLIINRAVSGQKYTYVKTTKRRHLRYEFNLNNSRFYELQAFVDINDLQWIILTNWKKEVWIAKFTNNPITYVLVDRTTFNVILEFEAYLLIAGDYPCQDK